MADKISSKPIRELVKYAESLGFTWNGKLSGRGHIILRHPEGGLVVLSGTPPKGSGMEKSRAYITKEAKRGQA
jgi:hypothetical protein